MCRLCEPVSSTHRTGLRRAETEIGKYRAETAAPNARFLCCDSVNALPETCPTCPKPRECRRVSEAEHVPNRDWNGWLRTQSTANPSPDWIPCYQGNLQGISRLRSPPAPIKLLRSARRSGISRHSKLARPKIEQGISKHVSGNYQGMIREFSARIRESL